MAEFSASTVLAMLTLVETTVVAFGIHISRSKADEEDVDDMGDDLEEAHEIARGNERRLARLDRRLTETEGR